MQIEVGSPAANNAHFPQFTASTTSPSTSSSLDPSVFCEMLVQAVEAGESPESKELDIDPRTFNIQRLLKVMLEDYRTEVIVVPRREL